MPGVTSLERGEYYAHGRNRFWRIMEELAGVLSDAAYQERLNGLLAAGVGLWDTLQECVREGSLDSMIRNAQLNDFRDLLATHPAIVVIGLNGNKAAVTFRRGILPTLPHAVANRLVVLDFPSTSPANARGGFEALLSGWRALEPWVVNRGPNAG